MSELVLKPELVDDYLKSLGRLPQSTSTTVSELGGGVSNRVLKVTWDGQCIVMKQPLPNLDVQDDWPADTERIHNEAMAAREYRRIVHKYDISGVNAPNVVFEDEANDIAAFEYVAADDTWKARLLAGEVDQNIAAKVGEALGTIHAVAAQNEELAASFSSDKPMEQLRINPYHRTVAQRHPELANKIESEITRLMTIKRTLVHGDYSPKNILISERGDGGSAIWIIDFEVASWGDPAFDPAFLLNHLFIKSIYNRTKQEAYIRAAFRFWDGYQAQTDWNIELDVLSELAILMLARIDGKSPVEYIDNPAVADALRNVGATSLATGTDTITEFADLIRSKTEQISEEE